MAACLENAIAGAGGFCCGKKYVVDHQVGVSCIQTELGKSLPILNYYYITLDDFSNLTKKYMWSEILNENFAVLENLLVFENYGRHFIG